MFISWRKGCRAALVFLRQPRLLFLAALAGLGATLLVWHYWPETYLRAARHALERRDYVAAQADLERYLTERPNSAEAHLLLARLYRRGNQYGGAAKHLDACARLGGFAEEVELERALLALQNGEFDPQLEKICRRHAVPGNPDEFLILEALSQGYSKTFHLPEAQFCLNRMLEIQPDNGYALRRRAWIYVALRKFKEAEADYRHALEIDAKDNAARLGLAQLLLDVDQDGAGAFEQFERLGAVQKDSATTVGRARSLALLGRSEEARRLLDEWLKDHANDSAALTERGKLALEEKQGQLAHKLLSRAVEINPSDPRANHTLYLCLVQQGKMGEAEQCQARFKQFTADSERMAELMRQLKEHPDDPDRRCQAAEIFLRQNQQAEGERWLLDNLRLHPHHRSSHLALADYYRRNGRNDLAELHRRLADAASSPSFSKP